MRLIAILCFGVCKFFSKFARPSSLSKLINRVSTANSKHAEQEHSARVLHSPAEVIQPKRPRPVTSDSRAKGWILARLILAFVILGVAAGFTWQFMSSSQAINARAAFDRPALGNDFNNHDFTGLVAIKQNGGEAMTSVEDKNAIYPLYITFELDSFNPGSGIIDGRVDALLYLPGMWPSGGGPVPKTVYVNSVPVKMTPPAVRTEVTPAYLAGSAAYSIQSVGSSSVFPSDSYAVNQAVVIEDRYDVSGFAAKAISVVVGPKMSSYHIEAHKTDNSWEISLLIHRNTKQIIWCYAIALSPVLLILVLIWQLAIRSSRIAIEAGIGVLAILPLRQVLVPPNVGGITNIDLILGMELLTILLLVSISAFKHSRITTASD